MARTTFLLLLTSLLGTACSAAIQVDLSRLGDAGPTDAGSGPGMDSGTPGTDSGSPGTDAGTPPVDAGTDARVILPFDAGPPRDVTCTSAGDCTCNTGDRCI